MINKIFTPKVSFIIPTLNAGELLRLCLSSIVKQDYPQEKIEIIVIDGFSQDKTKEIAKEFSARIFDNPQIDAESGKAIGIKNASGDYVILLDADNEIVQTDWLKKMLSPFAKEEKIFGVESYFLVNRHDSIWNRYLCLLQVNDPLARVTASRIKIVDKESYQVCIIPLRGAYPTGANGFIWRKDLIQEYWDGTSKLEEGNFSAYLVSRGHNLFARVKGYGIYHHYIITLGDYLKKRKKIGTKYMYRKQRGMKTWVDKNKFRFFIGIIYNCSLVGPLIEGVINGIKSKNYVWFLHPLVSFLTIWIYFFIWLQCKIKARI